MSEVVVFKIDVTGRLNLVFRLLDEVVKCRVMQLVCCFTSLCKPSRFRASGHVERFQDYMVKDLKNGECFRVDHLIEAHLEKLLSDKKLSADKKEEIRQLLPRVNRVLASFCFHIEIDRKPLKLILKSQTTS